MAISTLLTNENEDLYLPDGRNLTVLTGVQAVAQSCRQATKMYTTEDPLDQNAGVDWFGTVFTPQPDLDAARKSIAAALLSVQDTLSIESLTIDLSNNVFNYTAVVMTVYAQTVQVSGSITQ